MDNKSIIIGLSGSQKLAAQIAKNLKTRLTKTVIKHFADGETIVYFEESVRAKNVYLIQATGKPVNENVMELLIAIDALKRASAKSITVVCPYFGYARQDRKTNAREPITCKLVAELLETAGATRVLVLDIHSEQAQGFFTVPVDTVSASYVLIDKVIKDYGTKNTVIIAPDYGSVKRARKLAHELHLPIAILDKRRPKPNQAEICSVLGDVKGKNCVIVDDMIDTGGTLLAGCAALKKLGAKKIVAAATHGLFSNNASSKFNQAIKHKHLDALYVTNSLENPEHKKIKKLKIVDVSNLLSQIVNVYTSDGKLSISQLYAKSKLKRGI